MKTTEKQLINRLIKGGVDKITAVKLSDRHLDYINRVYPDDTLLIKSGIAMALGL